MSSSRSAVPCEFNPFDPRFIDDPYPVYAQLRQQSPIYRTIFGNWVITNFELSESVLRHPSFQIDNLPERLLEQSISYNDASFHHLSTIVDKWITFVNPPDHARLKRAISPSFTQQSIVALRPYVTTIVNSMLQSLRIGDSFDLIADIAAPLASLSITRLMGLPEHDAEKIMAWCADTVFIFDQPASLDTYKKQASILTEFGDYLRIRIQVLRQQPDGGLLSFLVQQQGEGIGLSDDEIISSVILLAATGQESTKGLIGNGLFAILNHPSSINLLMEQPSLLESAVEELLRFDSPIQYVARKASSDVTISNHLIKAGDYVVIYLGAANRDPEAFPSPDQLNFQRQTKNLGFGAGIHYCVGSFLAKLEMEVVLSSFLSMLQKYDVQVGKAERSKCRISRRLHALPLTFVSKDHATIRDTQVSC